MRDGSVASTATDGVAQSSHGGFSQMAMLFLSFRMRWMSAACA
jgi:hypothetical protein